MKTSNYSGYKGALPAVAISLTVPSWFKGKVYTKLAPTPQILSAFHKGMSEEEYRRQYRAFVLDHLDPAEVYADLKDHVLLCFEAPGKFCHRRLVAEWIHEKLGVYVPEVGVQGGFLHD